MPFRAFVRRSIQSRWFSVVVHNEIFAWKKELHQQYIHIFYTFFSAVESRSLSLCFLFRVYTIKKAAKFSTHSQRDENSLGFSMFRIENDPVQKFLLLADANLQPASSFFSLSLNSIHNKKYK